MPGTRPAIPAHLVLPARQALPAAPRAASLYPFPGGDMTPSDVLKLIKDKQVKFADLRFTDTRGKEQHVTIPARLVDEDLFRDGKMFDGSSIAGWKGINESDMILMPDAAHGGPRSVLRGDDRQHPLRRDRAGHHAGLRARPALARQARRGVPEVHRHRRLRALRPRERVLHLRPRALRATRCAAPSTRSTRCRARGTPRPSTRTATRAIARASRAATSRCRRWMPSRTSARPCRSPARSWD